jgi:hypothetical protein
MSRCFRWVTAIVVMIAAVTLVPHTADAQPTLTILSVQADTAAGQLVVRGLTFPAGCRVFLLANPVSELPVVSTTPTELHATLPSPYPAGTFMLLVFAPSGQYGLFNATMRAAIGPDVLVDANGKLIGSFDAPNQTHFTMSGRRLRFAVAPGGFSGSAFPPLYFDAACTVPYVPEPSVSFYELPPMTLSNGAQPAYPPYPTLAWFADHTQAPLIPSCASPPPAYLRNTQNVCVSATFNCNASWWPAVSLDLSGFVPPFRIE